MAASFVHKLSRAQAVLKANLTTDEATAKEYGVNVRTIEKWRANLMTDPDFLLAIEEQRKLLNQQFMAGLSSTLGMAVEVVYRLINEVATNPALLAKMAADPAYLNTVVTSIERLATVQMAGQVLESRLKLLEGPPTQPPDTRPPAIGGEPREIAGGTVRRIGPGIVEED